MAVPRVLRSFPFPLVALALACGSPRLDQPTPSVDEIPSPARPGSGEPHLAAAGGSAYLSWLEKQQDGTPALRFSRWDGQGWAPARTIASGDRLMVNWADFPSLLPMGDGTLVAHWLEKREDGPYAYDALVSQSTDGGATWGTPLRPHRDGLLTEHGFVSLVDLGPARFAAVWLDGRKLKSETLAHTQGEMQLMLSIWEDGAFGPEVVLDPRVCDCCQTAAVPTADGMFVAYRDRSPSEVRDISFLRGRGETWSAPSPVHEDAWVIPGCPVNGPAVARDGSRLAVAWHTEAGSDGKVQLAFSNDEGRTFGAPVRVDGGSPIGRVDVEWLLDGSTLVCWVEKREGPAAEVRARRVRPDRTADPGFVVAVTSSGRSSGFPRVVRVGSEVLLAWTDPGDPPRVRVARLAP